MATLTTTGRNAACDAIVDLLDSGLVKIYTTGSGTLLATMTLNATAFGAASTGVATANAITAGTAGNTGTAAEYKIQTSGAADILTGAVGTSGQDINFPTLSFVSGVDVGLSSLTVTVPAS